MTQIKPPTGSSSVLPPEHLQSPNTPDASVASTQNASGPSLGDLVEAAEQRAVPTEVNPSTDSLTDQIKAGTLTQSQAVDQLIEKALGDVASALSSEQRQDLEQTMRAALANDPTLIALQNDLGK